jgi:hypothetical protein
MNFAKDFGLFLASFTTYDDPTKLIRFLSTKLLPS